MKAWRTAKAGATKAFQKNYVLKLHLFTKNVK